MFDWIKHDKIKILIKYLESDLKDGLEIHLKDGRVITLTDNSKIRYNIIGLMKIDNYYINKIGYNETDIVFEIDKIHHFEI